jgi:hypothetical protein
MAQPTPEAPAPASTSYLRWPPPGLERLQGDLWRAVRELVVGGSFLVFPLLWAVGEARSFDRAGPFGESWWIVLATTVVGVLILLSAGVKTFRLLGRASQAAGQGYGWKTVALVAADRKRDTGFLLQGGRVFSVLEPSIRHRMATARLWEAGAWFAGALWHPLGFILGILLATRGLVTEGGLVEMTLIPSALLFLAGFALGAQENGILARARRDWHKKPWSKDLEREEVERWHRDLGGRDAAEALPAATPGSPRRLRLASWSVALVAVFIVVPALALVVSASVSPVLAMIAVPRFGETSARAARLEPLWRYRAAVDSTITPQEAGEALHALGRAGAPGGGGIEKEPVRMHPGFDLGDGPRNPTGIHSGIWSERLFAAWDTLPPEARGWLEQIAMNPAVDEFAIVGRAGSLDLLSGRWVLPYPADLNPSNVPIPRFGTLRNTGYAAIARAAVQLGAGRPRDAEQTLRELATTGLLMMRDAPSLLDNLIGTVVAENGANALAALYRETGRGAEADALLQSMEDGLRTAERANASAAGDRYSTIRGMPGLVLDDAALRGLRWEFFVTLSTIAPCMSVNQIVFGPGSDYASWLAGTREDLVQFPSEVPYYELMSRGWFGRAGEAGPQSLLGRLFTMTMGGEGAGSCALMLEGMGGLGELF